MTNMKWTNEVPCTSNITTHLPRKKILKSNTSGHRKGSRGSTLHIALLYWIYIEPQNILLYIIIIITLVVEIFLYFQSRWESYPAQVHHDNSQDWKSVVQLNTSPSAHWNVSEYYYKASNRKSHVSHLLPQDRLSIIVTYEGLLEFPFVLSQSLAYDNWVSIL